MDEIDEARRVLQERLDVEFIGVEADEALGMHRGEWFTKEAEAEQLADRVQQILDDEGLELTAYSARRPRGEDSHKEAVKGDGEFEYAVGVDIITY